MNENGKTKTLELIIVLLITGSIIGFVISNISYESGEELIEKRGFPFKAPIERQTFTISYTAGIVFTSINIFLLIGLLWVYGIRMHEQNRISCLG